MKIETINREQAQIIREILNSDLAPILEQYGLSLEIGNASFDSNSINFKNVRIALESAPSKNESALEQELEARKTYNWRGGLLDTTKIHKQGKRAFQLTGFKPKARKNCWVVTDLNTSDEFVITEPTAQKWFSVS